MKSFRPFGSLISILAVQVLTFSAHGEGFSFQNLSDEDFKKVVQDMSANFVHTSVSGASPLGDIFGFELGIVGGQTSTPELDKYAKEVDPSVSADKVPHGEIIGIITVPLAITAEIGLIPKVGQDDFKFSSYHLAAKWTPSELFFELPVSIATKVQYSQVNVEIKDTINTIPTTFDYDSSILGVSAIVSKNLAVFEPYVGFGYMKADGKMDVTGSTTVFTGGSSATSKPSSSMFMVGTEVKLLVVKLGVEYMNVFDTSRFTGKVSFYF
jgi:hypothetical protein